MTRLYEIIRLYFAMLGSYDRHGRIGPITAFRETCAILRETRESAP